MRDAGRSGKKGIFMKQSRRPWYPGKTRSSWAEDKELASKTSAAKKNVRGRGPVDNCALDRRLDSYVWSQIARAQSSERSACGGVTPVGYPEDSSLATSIYQ